MPDGVKRLLIAAALIVGVFLVGTVATALVDGDAGRQIGSNRPVAEGATTTAPGEAILGGAGTITAPRPTTEPPDTTSPAGSETTTTAGGDTTTPTTATPDTTSGTAPPTATTARPTTGPDPALAAGFANSVPDWVVFPGEEWQTATPQQAGLRPGAWNNYLGSIDPRVEKVSGLHRQYPNQWGVAVTRGGYLVHTAGNPDAVFQSASVGKTFTRLVLLIAEKKGLIDSIDDPIRRYWTGDGSEGEALSSPHKYMNEGYNADVTFRDIAFHRAGFPVSNGSGYAGDPFFDNYAKVPSGTFLYSSGGMWRLSQVLTYIFDDELKNVLDRELFQYMGIQPEDWDWVTGEAVFNDRDFWPVFNRGPNNYYGAFVDPPYRIGDNDVQGGGGWVEMSPKDLARVGLLIATDGYWGDRQLISPVDAAGLRGAGNLRYLGSHSGYADSRMEGSEEFYDASAWVRTAGFNSPDWDNVVSGAARG